MTPETITKTREFYRPEFSQENRVLQLHHPNGKTIPVIWTKQFTLCFGADPLPKSKEEARERGFPTLTGRELFAALLSPEEFEAVRSTKEIDPRTATYLEATKKGIGLLDRRDGYDGEKFTAEEKTHLGVGLDLCPVGAEIGQLADGRWVAEWSVRTDIDDYCITDLYFNHKPTATEIDKAILVDSIETAMAWKHRYNPGFRCWECGIQCPHWLDITEETDEAKWDAFQESYCGC
jgi:hypothetical protein